VDKFNRLLELDFTLADKCIGVKVVWKVVKCTKQFALTVVRNAKFLLSLTRVDRYIAENVGLKEDRPGQVLAEEDTRHCIR
jgi:hypothetical protein